ncbi:MAG: histidine phosphatase family protein [Ruminococcus sp.]|nr:histidine phosphatase family protein [Ruminococcus sp.]
MRILIIRHGEPDYAKDCLTERGREQAELLAERIAPMEIAAYYASPMGRAQETCAATVRKAGREFTTLGWLHEFDVQFEYGKAGRLQTWDMPPKYWAEENGYYDLDNWCFDPGMRNSDIEERVKMIYDGLDGLLEGYGYVRRGSAYEVRKRFDGTIALYCHFGAGCVMISRLLNLSPVLSCNSFSCEPTAIAQLCTDDRFGGTVNFRLHSYGDIAHLSGDFSEIGKGTLVAR